MKLDIRTLTAAGLISFLSAFTSVVKAETFKVTIWLKAELHEFELGAQKRKLATACRMRSRHGVLPQLHSIKHSG